jgi:hypothetical protein
MMCCLEEIKRNTFSSIGIHLFCSSTPEQPIALFLDARSRSSRTESARPCPSLIAAIRLVRAGTAVAVLPA